EPQNNPGPVRVDDKSVRIPGWPAAAYLLRCAKISDERVNVGLAKKVMAVVRAVSLFTDETGQRRDNFYTYSKFAEILGAVPIAAVRLTDVDLAALWLDSDYDRSLVPHALDIGATKRF